MVSRKKIDDEDTYLSMPKKVSESLSFNLQQLIEKIMSIVNNVDTSDIEDIDFCNDILDKFNNLIDVINLNLGTAIDKLKFLQLTDEFGNIVKDYRNWVVGELYVEDGHRQYYKRRIVYARTPKEAIYKYSKVDDSLGASLICIGEYDETTDYSKNIENIEIIK